MLTVYVCVQLTLDKSAPFTSVQLNCSDINASGLGSVDCVSYSWGRVLDEDNHGICNLNPYNSSSCRQQLLAWQECALGSAEDLFLDFTFGELSLEEKERDASQFLHFLRRFSHTYTALIYQSCRCNCCIPFLFREFGVRLLSESSELGCLSELFPSL